jgi:hypothetical protein
LFFFLLGFLLFLILILFQHTFILLSRGYLLNKNIIFALTASSIFLIAVAGIIIFSDLSAPNPYSIEVEGVILSSDSKPVLLHLEELGKEQEFIVSSEFPESGEMVSSMTEALTMFGAILSANNKNVTLLARVISPSNELIKCQTNDSNASVNREITAEECNALLDNAGAVKILVSVPQKTPKTRVSVSEKTISMLPTSEKTVSFSSSVVLKHMFSNSEFLQQKINELIERLN